MPAVTQQSNTPSARELRRLVTVAEPARLLEFDPTGFLAQLLEGRDEGITHAKPVSEDLFHASPSIEDQLLRAGLPRNPDSEAVLKELFSPKLLREAIFRFLQEESASTVPLRSVAALCFVCHPFDSLEEIRFVSRQLFRSDGRSKVWTAVSDGLVSACRIVPRLWIALEPGERRLLRGPDCLVSCMRGRDYHYLLLLPAFIVEQVLARQKLPEPSKAQSILESLLYSHTGLLENPGLLPVLKHLRRSTGRLPERLITTLVVAIQDSVAVRGEHGPRRTWIQAHRTNEPVRDQLCADSLVRQFVQEVMECEEISEALSRFGTNTPEVIAGIRDERARLLDKTRRSVRNLLILDPDFKEGDIAEIVGALETYRTETLKHCEEQARSLLVGAGVPTEFHCGCELAVISASSGFDKLARAQSAFESAANREDPAYAVVARVALASRPREDVAAYLAELSSTTSWGCVVHNWDLVPKGHEAALYRALLAHGPSTGLPEEMILAGCKHWGEMSEAEAQAVLLRGLEENARSAQASVRCFVVSLSKLEAPDLEFLSWRAAMTRLVLDLPPIFLVNPLTTSTLISLLYEGSLTEEIEGSPIAQGLRSHVCSLKLSMNETDQLSAESQKILKEINRWLNGAFSDYALERGLVTPVSVFLEHSGHTKRTVRDLLLCARQILRSEPSCDSVRTLLLVVKAFHYARARGHSLERLRRSLVKRGLLQYVEQEISMMAASETYLRRYGLKEESRTLVQFPALIILKRIREAGGDSSASISSGVRGTRSSIAVARRSKEELGRLVAQCRAALEAEITLKRPHSFLQLMKIPAERRQLQSVLANILLGTACLLGGGIALNSLTKIFKGNKDGVISTQSLIPNGSLPKVKEPVAKLSSPFRDPRSRYLLRDLVGASDVGATQPALDYPGRREVGNWILGRTDRPIVDIVDLDFYNMYRGPYGGLPIGGRGRNLRTRMGSDAVPLPQSAEVPLHEFRFVVFQELAEDQTVRASELSEMIGVDHAPLIAPRLLSSDISRVSPPLFEAIRVARDMPAAKGAEHLRTVVSRLIKYQESPQYDDFDGDFREYFEAIVKSGRGICGQFSVVLDEALKQAGIPCCIANVYLPDDDGVTYTTAGAHATNIVFLVGRDKEVIPRIYDATGGAERLPGIAPTSRTPFEELALPGVVVLGGVGALALLMANRRRRTTEKHENEALTLVTDEALRSSEEADNSEVDSEYQSQPQSPAQLADDLFGQWLLHHLQESCEFNRQEANDLIFNDLKDDDFDQILRSADRMKRVLLEMTAQTRELFSKTGLFEQESTIGILNGWLRSMESPSARREWVQHLQRRDLFLSQEAEALMRVAREVMPDFKTDARGGGGAIAGVWRLFSRPVPLQTQCLLRAFVPLPDPSRLSP